MPGGQLFLICLIWEDILVISLGDTPFSSPGGKGVQSSKLVGMLGTGHYLSPGGGGAEDFFGGGTQICLENEDMGGGRESHQMLLRGITSVK